MYMHEKTKYSNLQEQSEINRKSLPLINLCMDQAS